MANASNTPSSDKAPLFTPAVEQRTSGSLLPWLMAGVMILLVVAGIVSFSSRTPKRDAKILLPLDPYSRQLTFTDIVMSESTSLSGGKSTFIDGHVHNLGTRIVTRASLQVIFQNFDPTLPAQVELAPLTLIRTHEPYIDTEPVAESPLAPGADKEFRLIFENVSPGWNQQLPTIRPVEVGFR